MLMHCSTRALVKIVRLPCQPNRTKNGLDDFLVANPAKELRKLMDQAALWGDITLIKDKIHKSNIPPPPPVAACPNRKIPALSSKENPNDALAILLACKRWSCPVCCKRLRYAWIVHLTNKILSHGGPLHYLKCPTEELPAVLKSLSKRLRSGDPADTHQQGEWARITIGKESLVILSRPVPGSKQIPPPELFRLIVQWVQRIPQATKQKGTHFRPVVAGRAWKMPPPEKSGRWKREALIGHRNPERLVADVEAGGMKVDEGALDGGEWFGFWSFFEDSTAEERTEAFARLAAGLPLSPRRKPDPPRPPPPKRRRSPKDDCPPWRL